MRTITVSVAFCLTLAARPALASWPHTDPGGGLPVCTAAGTQTPTRAISDGAGGAIVVWTDGRAGNNDVYAQRIGRDGTLLWAATGVPLCTNPSSQTAFSVVSDLHGGAIAVWSDQRPGNRWIYAQHVDSTGTVLWATDGVPVGDVVGLYGSFLYATSDGAGGVLITWADFALNVTAQRLDPSGNRLWGVNGVVVCPGATVESTSGVVGIARDGSGGAYVSWADTRNGTVDTYVQRVASSGVPQWSGTGQRIIPGTTHQRSVICEDGTGRAILVGKPNAGLLFSAFCVGAGGGMPWGTTGVPLSSLDGFAPTVVSDGAGACVSWAHDVPETGDEWVLAQKVSAGGAVQWGADGIVACAASYHRNAISIAADEAGGCYIVWPDLRNGFADIYAQHVSAPGSNLWPADALPVCTSALSQGSTSAVVTDQGGAIFVWRDNRTGEADLYAQRVDAWGYAGDTSPVLDSITDVPGDQGGSVTVSWTPSWLDVSGGTTVADYQVWRLDGSWQMVATTPATGASSYALAVPTTSDSSALDAALTTFKVEARSGGPAIWESQTGSGSSVDNLAPAIPAPFTGRNIGDGNVALHWGTNVESDFLKYHLHRGDSDAFVPGPGNQVAEQADTGYVDSPPGPSVYKLTAEDVHGNVSAAATLEVSDIVGIPEWGGFRLALDAPSPNPLRASAQVRYALSRPGHVRLALYDVAGRRVRTLRDGEEAMGARVVKLTAFDSSGSRLAAGVYVLRLEAEGRSLTRRIAVVP